MEVANCKCSRSIHIFAPAGSATCPFCGNSIDKNQVIDNSFKKPYLFLNKKLSEADQLIGTPDFDKAKSIINEVLGVAPGPKIGDLPNTGELYWRKLLIESKCRKDKDLLIRGKLLKYYSAFNNAMKYATEDEKPAYALISKIKELILANLKDALRERELNEKRDIGADNLLNEYRKELNAKQNQANDNIVLLEKIEKDIRENTIDYMAAAGEFEHSINDIYAKIKGVGNPDDKEISLKQRDSLMEQLQIHLSQGQQEIENLGKLKTTNKYYLNYVSLRAEEKDIISNVQSNISKIKNLQSRVENCLKTINQIAEKYNSALSALEEGNYNPALSLIPKSRLDEIIKRSVAKR